MRATLLVTLLLAAPLAGCLSETPQEEPAPPHEPVPQVTVDEDGTLRLDVPIDVVLLGFPADAANALRERLQQEEVAHIAHNNGRGFATDRLDGGSPFQAPFPFVPTAQYDLHIAPEAFTDAYWAQAATTQVEEGLLNATAIEAWLLEELHLQGHVLDPDRPMLVLVHAGERMDRHTYRYHGNVGYMDNVRLFGERFGFLVADLSAQADPFAGTSREYQAYVRPDEVAGAAEDLVRDITHFRLLQGPLYPPSTKPCHAVTMILGVRSTAVTDVLPGFTPAAQAMAAQRLTNHFKNLTGADNVHVDVTVLALPQDDPVLDAVTRDRLDLSTFRFWLDENWDHYWVAHEGCEPYVSFALYGDFGDQPVLFSGIAMYDVQRSHRISFSVVSELTRIQSEWPGFSEEVDGIVSSQQAGRAPSEWFNRLYSHETGHLFGQRHPHDINAPSYASSRAFSSVWSTMSYQVRGVLDDFGTVDQANFARNRAAFAHHEVYHAGLTNTPAYNEALGLLGQNDWRAAGDVLVSLLEQEAGASGQEAPRPLV